jgi:mono/diheme cytochrome c family protein
MKSEQDDKATVDASAQRVREHSDPDEGIRPLPWFLTMFLGAMAMWGSFYIYSTPSGERSYYGDQRTVSDLRPAVAGGAAVAKVDGAALYAAKCVACHQASGLGLPGVFPPLAGSEWVTGDEKTLINILLHGVTGAMQVKGASYTGAMPGWKAMTDDELAGLMSYIRSDWGNAGAIVKAEAVKQQREATKARTEPFKGEQELKAGG